jgi:hypothetical protein
MLHQDEPVGIVIILAKFNISPLKRHEFATSKARSDRR